MTASTVAVSSGAHAFGTCLSCPHREWQQQCSCVWWHSCFKYLCCLCVLIVRGRKQCPCVFGGCVFGGCGIDTCIFSASVNATTPKDTTPKTLGHCLLVSPACVHSDGAANDVPVSWAPVLPVSPHTDELRACCVGPNSTAGPHLSPHL